MSLTDLPIELLGQLPKRDRMLLRKQFPMMPDYLFMNKKEKRQYFAKKYSTYQRQL